MGRWGGGTPESEQKNSGERFFGFGDMVDQLCIVFPVLHIQEMQTNYQKRQEIKDPIACDVVILDGSRPGYGEVHPITLIFSGKFIGLSKRHCGAGSPGCDIPPLLGTVTQDNRIGPPSRTWLPLHENQNAVQLADAWAEGQGRGFVPSTPQQVEQECQRRQRQSQQASNDQMGWPDDAQPRGGQQRQQQGGWQQNRPASGPPSGGWGGRQGNQRPPQQQGWGNQGGGSQAPQGPPQGGWGGQQAPQGPPQGGWNQQQQNRPAPGPPAAGWANQAPPQQNQPQPPAWAQQSATNQAPPQQDVPQPPAAQSTFDQMAQQQGFAQQGSGYAGGSGSEDPWGTERPPY